MTTLASQQLKFRIGEAFPDSDPVARWMTILAMASNDFLRIFNWVAEADDAGSRLLAFRIQAATLHELAVHLGEPVRRWPEVQAFIDGLDAQAREEAERVRGAVDSESPHYLGPWIETHRHVTFHYPVMHPERAEHGKEEIQNALAAAGDQEGEITYTDGVGSVRFGFADEVAVKWLPDVTEGSAPEILALREMGMALVRFSQRAMQAYLESLPTGVVGYDP